MILTVSYRNGEKRVVHLHKDFYSSTPATIFNKKTMQVETKVLTPSDKAIALAEYLGNQPFKIRLEREGKEQFSKTIHANEPIPFHKPLKIDEKKIKKQFKKEAVLREKTNPLKVWLHATY